MGMKGRVEYSGLPCKWAYDDMFFFTSDFCNNSNCFSDCGMTWHHRWRGEVAAAPLRTAMKWSFQNWMDFFGNVVAVIVRWYELVSHSGGTYFLFIFL